jgi:flavin reductase (DIM6/NTAB) family NADH-FMN oxidoreductase RutF
MDGADGRPAPSSYTRIVKNTNPAASAVTKDEFRRALGRFATGVTVVTLLNEQGQVHGMTANAFCSVSLEPLRVLVCVDLRARMHPLIAERRRFAINVLREDQQPLADFFAKRHPTERDASRHGIHFVQTRRGTPLLADCLAQLDCDLDCAHECGDHTIYVADVQEVVVHEGEPLLFYGGRYRSFSGLLERKQKEEDK